MNDNFNPIENHEVMSPEEQSKHKNTFSKICLAFLAFILITELLATLASYAIAYIDPELLKDTNISLVLSALIQYLVGLPLFIFFIKKIPSVTPSQKSLTAKEFFKLSAIAIFIMQVGNYISTMIVSVIEENLGYIPENAVSTLLTDTNILLSALIVGIIGPIVEEIMFRKLAIDRLTPYGEKVAVFLPAFIFGLIHGNLYQFFYAFFLGIIFSFIYVKTGKIIYSIVLHCFINLFCGVLPAYALGSLDLEELLEIAESGNITPEYIEQNYTALSLLSLYGIVLTVMMFVGLFAFNRNLYRIRFKKGEITLPKGSGADIIFFNKGAIALIAVCVIIIAISTFAPAV